jgi:hypothetical protein
MKCLSLFVCFVVSTSSVTAQHWAFVPPKRPPVPAIRDARNPIDAVIRQRLEREKLAPAPEADRATLIRRVTLDLTGLPPTPAEVDAFLDDQSPNAYEKVVARLLASPRYGERMAMRWLDAARYADTNGYQSDGERTMWRWRDWVIDAFNANMPFDQFTIEQLAGDLLPNATLEQRIATGFNRNHRGNGEGGIIPEEYAVEYVVDRVDTTATVWLGLTMGCVRCHDHKYDPFAQREYYQLFAFFNNVPEQGRAIKYGNSPPYIPSPTRDQQRKLDELNFAIHQAAVKVQSVEARLRAEQSYWMQDQPIQWFPERALLATISGATYPRLLQLDGNHYFDAGDLGEFGFYDKFTLAARINAADVKNAAIVSRMPETPQADGYAVRLVDGRVRVELTKRWLDDALRVETLRSLEPARDYHIAVTYDGSRLAKGVHVYIDGNFEKTAVLLDELNQTFATKEPLRIGSGGGPESRFRGWIGSVRVYGDVLSDEEVSWLADNRPLQAGSPSKDRAFFIARMAPKDIREIHQRFDDLKRERQRLIESFPTTMVMEELPEPRPAFVLKRGEYDKLGERVYPGFPTALASRGVYPRGEDRRGKPGGSLSRLDLAKWIVAPDNPLAARVAVNRLWQQFFGTGLVKTAEDFGTRGERPSHPELLDWLAVEFRESGWDVKALVRQIVTSATYRQSSAVRHSVDPENRLLSRGPRLRLSAEMIRDQALSASGLLVERVGGPSVRPYQPIGLGKELGADDYVPGHGADLHRRGLYTFWKRTVQPPNMLAFDAAGREACSVREVRTNTPLQALTLLNDVTFVEAARKLAERAMREAGASPESRIAHAFRLVLARRPTDAELRILAESYAEQLREFRRDPQAAKQLLKAGESPIDPKLDRAELGALSSVASLILNLDEAVTKE